MIKVGKESRLVPSEVIGKAVAFFGPGGLGLEVTESAECCARFEGGGGYVFVQAAVSEKGKGSEVEVESREFEYDAKQFLGKI